MDWHRKVNPVRRVEFNPVCYGDVITKFIIQGLSSL